MDPITTLHPVIAYVLATALALTTLAAAWKALMVPTWTLLRLFIRFLYDWNGEPDKGIPSFPVRVAVLEDQMEAVHHETHSNSGKSLKDIVTRTEQRVVGVEAVVRRLTEDFARHQDESRRRDERLAVLETFLSARRQRATTRSGGNDDLD